MPLAFSPSGSPATTGNDWLARMMQLRQQLGGSAPLLQRMVAEQPMNVQRSFANYNQSAAQAPNPLVQGVQGMAAMRGMRDDINAGIAQSDDTGPAVNPRFMGAAGSNPLLNMLTSYWGAGPQPVGVGGAVAGGAPPSSASAVRRGGLSIAPAAGQAAPQPTPVPQPAATPLPPGADARYALRPGVPPDYLKQTPDKAGGYSPVGTLTPQQMRDLEAQNFFRIGQSYQYLPALNMAY